MWRRNLLPAAIKRVQIEDLHSCRDEARIVTTYYRKNVSDNSWAMTLSLLNHVREPVPRFSAHNVPVNLLREYLIHDASWENQLFLSCMATKSKLPQRLAQVVLWTLANFCSKTDIADRGNPQNIALIHNVQILVNLGSHAIKEE